jgi:drug/metabolite transporter (DMT)-like permease
MVAAPVLWSTAGVVTRHVERAGALEQVFWRSLFAFLFVFVVLILKTNPWKAVRSAGWPGLVSGLMWAVMFTAFVLALSMTTTANTLVVMSVSPLLTVLLARAVLSDQVPVRTWIAAGAAAAGIAWMFAASLEKHFAAMAVAFVIPVAAAINVVVLRASAAKFDLVPAVMLGGAISCVLVLPFALPFS